MHEETRATTVERGGQGELPAKGTTTRQRNLHRVTSLSAGLVHDALVRGKSYGGRMT